MLATTSVIVEKCVFYLLSVYILQVRPPNVAGPDVTLDGHAVALIKR